MACSGPKMNITSKFLGQSVMNAKESQREMIRTGTHSGEKQIKICHIAATTEGAAWLAEQLSGLRDDHGFDVSVILNGQSGTLVDRLRLAGVKILSAEFDFTRSGDLFSLPRKVIGLMRLLAYERFDVIHTHFFHSMIIGRIAAWFADVPVRVSMIAGPFHLEAYTPRWIDRWTCWMDTAIIASCQFTRTLYRNMWVPDRRLELIYYGPDANKFDPDKATPADIRTEFGWDSEAPLVGMVAYFYPQLGVNRWTPPTVQGEFVKRQEDFIYAARLILAEKPDARFVLVGSGFAEGGRTYMERMQHLAAELGLDPFLRFTGFRTDIPAILRALDVAVQPSLSENLGGTIESLLMECPTVATRVGGMTDSIIEGETGVLVNPRDPEDLKRGILKILQDKNAAKHMASVGRKKMLEKFTLRNTVDELAALYKAKLEKAPQGYRPFITLIRIVLGGSVCVFISARYFFFDALLLPRWDAGWRPWHFRRPPRPNYPVSFSRLILYRFYTFVGKHSSLGIRQRLRAMIKRLFST